MLHGGSLTTRTYIEEILEEHHIIYASFILKDFIYDNVQLHIASIQETNIHVLELPESSRNSNHIQQVKDYLNTRSKIENVFSVNLQDQ